MQSSVVLVFLTAFGVAQQIAVKGTEYMEAQVRVNHYSGAVLLAKDGKTLFTHAYGFADAENRVPNTIDTKFRIASITKIFTAAAVLMLRDEGKLSLDDSICKYISSCPELWRPITLRNLLTHSSGIPDDFAEITPMRREHRSPAEFIEAIKRHSPSFPPGGRVRYSNSGFILLGGVIAKVSGQSYADFLRSRIFTPLNMKHTIAETCRTLDEAFGYSWDGSKYQKADLLDVSGLSAASMVASTVGDLLVFVESLQEGKLLKQSTVKEMWTPQVEQSGYAWHLGDVNGRKVVSHGGDIEGFSDGLYYYPDEHLLVVSLSNVAGIPPSGLIRDLTAIALNEQYSMPHERTFVQLSADQMKPFVGTYRLNSGVTICVTLQADRLMMAPGNGRANACRPESTDKCFLPPITDDVTFVRDSAGAVAGFRFGSHTDLDAVKKSNTEYQGCPALFAH